ncbi:DNA-binding protein [Oculatella sp. LEGE 06141]|uniref:PPC domain-containing DNA-binding protein n=1 Tax=Oculatella sp. LEGE 06141 TaxID=1828648 RepID=UPI001881BC69|nr:PPC domain-containing DNA-binding protein [Oculatella sp. LEGE 06141]MBE9178442.1 DNA-binding protein [Oculatella sp. LEGE 06141]
MKAIAVRLKPNQDLKQSLRELAEANGWQASFILTAVGSLKQARIRFANQASSTVFQEPFEIVSLVGTLSVHGIHLHISLADRTGKTIGGHLDDGCLIYTTAELVIGEISHLVFAREADEQTGFNELTILPKCE